MHTKSMLARLDELAEQEVPPELAIDEMELWADAALLRGELDGFWEGLDRSGVDVASTTIGAFGSQPFTYDNAIRDLARWARKFDALDSFVRLTKAADAERAHAEGKARNDPQLPEHHPIR